MSNRQSVIRRPWVSFGSADDSGALIDHYVLLEAIGQGGMAEVFKAVGYGPAEYRRPCVIKRIRREMVSNMTFVRMFADEARITARLRHPNIVRMYEYGETEDSYFMALELLIGRDLSWIFREANRAGRAIPLDVATYVAHETARALHHAHELRDEHGEPLQLVHRDVSPANVMLLRKGRVKMLDFGVAKVEWALRESETQGGEIKGKLAYLSPEQLGKGKLDHRADLFSLGVVLWELLTGQRLFSAPTAAETVANVVRLPIAPPSTVRADVPPELDAIVMRALERDPEQRFASAADFADALAHLAGAAQRNRPRMAARFLASLQQQPGAAAEPETPEPASASHEPESGAAPKPTTGRYRGVGGIPVAAAAADPRPPLVFDDATVIDDDGPSEGTVTRVYSDVDAARVAQELAPGQLPPAAAVTRELPVTDTSGSIAPAPEGPRVVAAASSHRAATMFGLGVLSASAAFAFLTFGLPRVGSVRLGVSGAAVPSALMPPSALGSISPTVTSTPIAVPEPAPVRSPPRRALVVRKATKRAPSAPAVELEAEPPAVDPADPPGGDADERLHDGGGPARLRKTAGPPL